MTAEPRIRVSAVLRWDDQILLCRHEKPGKEYWLLPGGGVHSGELARSEDAAVRGHRLFSVTELDSVVVHPPLQRFLQRWRPGDPVAYLGALWVA